MAACQNTRHVLDKLAWMRTESIWPNGQRYLWTDAFGVVLLIFRDLPFGRQIRSGSPYPCHGLQLIFSGQSHPRLWLIVRLTPFQYWSAVEFSVSGDLAAGALDRQMFLDLADRNLDIILVGFAAQRLTYDCRIGRP